MAKSARTNLRVASCEDELRSPSDIHDVGEKETASRDSRDSRDSRASRASRASRPSGRLPASRSSRASFIMLWTAAVLATAAAFIVHLSMRFETIDLGYDVGAERTEQRRLIEECRLLSLEAATLRDSARVESVARGVLEMDVPSPDRVVPVLPVSAQRRTSGRVQ